MAGRHAGRAATLGLRRPECAALRAVARPAGRLGGHGGAGSKFERVPMVGDPDQHGSALLEGICGPARLEKQRAQVQAKRHVVWRSSNCRLEPFKELRVDHDHDSMANADPSAGARASGNFARRWHH